MIGRTQHKDLIDFFGRGLGVTHGTMSTNLSLPGNVDVLQIQFDTLTSASATSFRISRGGTIIKSGAYASGAGTREVTWAGRAISFDNNFLRITRPLNDTHTIFWTIVYTRN